MTEVRHATAPEIIPARGRLIRPAGIVGTGMALPDQVVTNADLASTLKTSDQWIRQRIGIRERRFLEPGRATSDLCVNAALEALRRSDTAAGDLSAIVLSTITPDYPLPSTALIVKDAIGAGNALPIDLNQAACVGGIQAMLLGASLLQQTEGRVLVIGGETLSRLTDPHERTTRVIFGDAAGAAVLGHVEDGYGILGWDTGSELSFGVRVAVGGSARPASPASIARGEHYLAMDGAEVWRMATARLPHSVRNAVARVGADLADVRHFIFHQANARIIEMIMRDLDQPLERAPKTIETLGNTGSATVFTVLHTLAARSDLSRGDLIVIAGIGAGFMWGSLCLRHG
jgi:3-oxoacyl-[acyl-carrier-protein] synthase III